MSRVAAGRVFAERALRGVALGALALALWRRLAPAPGAEAAGVERADGRALPVALARWTAAPARAADVRLDSLPGPVERAWLAALASAGTRVTWRAVRAPALAVAAEGVADPAGGVRVLAAAERRAVVAVADTLGPLDSAAAPGTGNVSASASTVLLVPSNTGTLRARTAGTTARVAAPPAPRLGAVLVVARAGWEGRFAAAALEERGWTVRTRFAVAPGVVVAAGGARRGSTAAPDSAPRPAPTPLPRLDTATVAAVVALDSSIAPLAPAVARYVRAGGGLVLAGDAALVPALAVLAPAAAGPAVDDSAGLVHPLERPRADAVPLAWRRVDGARTLVAAARRVGAGRVVQLADVESWRRRMRPADGAPAEHRAWWTQAVAAAAYAPAPPSTPPPDTASRLAPPSTDPAPLAATVAALGPPDSTPERVAGARPARAPSSGLPSDAVLVPLALAALAGEVASRRLRGVG